MLFKMDSMRVGTQHLISALITEQDFSSLRNTLTYWIRTFSRKCTVERLYELCTWMSPIDFRCPILPPVCVSGSLSGVFAAAGHSAARRAAGGGRSLSMPPFPLTPTVVITVWRVTTHGHFWAGWMDEWMNERMQSRKLLEKKPFF